MNCDINHVQLNQLSKLKASAMKSKFITKLAIALPVAAASVLPFSGAAQAVVFSNGDTMNVTTNNCVSIPALGSVVEFTKIYFAPPEGGSTFDCPDAGGTPGALSAAALNTLADLSISGIANSSALAASFAMCNTGGGVSGICDGDIRSFEADPVDNPNVVEKQLGGDNYFISVLKDSGEVFVFGLNTMTIANSVGGTVLQPDLATCPGGVLGIDCELNVDFQASGKVAAYANATDALNFANALDWANVTYSYAGPRFRIVAGAGTDADPFLTTTVTSAANIIATVKAPEPGTVSGLFVLGLMGVIGGAAKKLRK